MQCSKAAQGVKMAIFINSRQWKDAPTSDIKLVGRAFGHLNKFVLPDLYFKAIFKLHIKKNTAFQH